MPAFKGSVTNQLMRSCAKQSIFLYLNLIIYKIGIINIIPTVIMRIKLVNNMVSFNIISL